MTNFKLPKSIYLRSKTN